MISSRLIKSNNAAAGCVDIVDAYDPFDGNGVALYQLNGNANDVSGNYNGTPTSVTYGTGVFGQAGVFNGSTSKVELPISVVAGNVLTVSLWFNSTSNNSPTTLFSARGSASSDVKFIISLNRDAAGDGKIGIDTGTSTGFVTLGTYAGNYNDGNWHHVVATINYTTKDYKVYIDGISRISGNNSSIYTGWNVTKAQIGVNNLIQYLNGSIDQVRIFNTALDPLEVEALYTEELCLCGGTVDTLDILDDSSCIALYPLDGNANDLSGNYSGTPTNVSYGVGEFDLAGVFNGSSSSINTNFAQNTSNAFSWSFWFNGSSSQGGIPLIIDTTSNTPPYPGVGIGYEASTVYIFISGGTVVPGASVSPNTWAHVVLTHDGSGNFSFYVNNSPVFTNVSRTSNLYSGQNILLGDTTVWSKFNGSIDQVRIFNKALNSTEVTTLYNETACTPAACVSGTTNTLDILGDGSCIATYTLDGTPADLSGNYNGVQTNVTYPQGYFDLAGAFNGSTSTFNTGIQTSSNDVNSYSMWFKTTVGGYLLFKQPTGTTYGFRNASIDKNTGFCVALAWGGSGNQIQSAVDYRDNQWHNVVVIFNYPTKELYVDGQFIASNSSPEGSTPATNPLYIGSNDTASYVFGGEIDQFRIFNKALSAGEVTTLYNETPCN